MIHFEKPVRLIAVLLAAAIAPTAMASSIYGIYLADSSATNGDSASYATGPGVSIYSTGGLATSLNPGGIAVMIPGTAQGLTSASLAYSTTVNTAAAQSAANMANGSLHAMASSNGAVVGCGTSCTYTGIAANSEASFLDYLTFGVTGGGPANITVIAHMDGTIIPSASTNHNYTVTSSLAIGGYGYAYEVSAPTPGSPTIGVANNPYAPTLFGVFSNETATGYDFSGTVSVTNGQQLEVLMDLMLGSTNGVDADFSNTNSLSLILPSNVTFTSASGVFLTQTASAPEPSSLLLLGAGLIGMILYRRKSGRSVVRL
jgi:hypothetical protein